ncbi:hypothetical protein ACG2F4_05690 [Halalkalibaculum sp. DA3122]
MSTDHPSLALTLFSGRAVINLPGLFKFGGLASSQGGETKKYSLAGGTSVPSVLHDLERQIRGMHPLRNIKGTEPSKSLDKVSRQSSSCLLKNNF